MREFFSKMSPLIKDYLEFREAMGYSTRHARELRLFDLYCCESHPDLDQLNREAARGWISDEIARGRSALTYKVSAIREFAKYLGNGTYVLPTNTVPKKKEFTPYILTDGELAALFYAIDNVQGVPDFFLRETISVLWRLLYTCGLRPREGRLIKCSEICLQTGEILITKAKRNKERIVVMSDDMVKMCRAYATQRSIIAGNSAYFFVNGEGEALPAYQLCLLFRHCWAQANPEIPAHLLPNLRQYDLRHRYASTVLQKWLDEGRNLYAMLPYLRTYMGHEKFADTAYYIHILPENLLKSPGVDWGKLDAIVPGVEVWKD